ncbi:conserved hypothetical protein [Candidatus Desulfarcum epimagneticum]|uniref:Uncharacterized protein n=1 Tax=uncultured Desulfobacteraceae bacterium TaxID=218296 RepID=A0A484HGK8_9BACT|nr:conserved hypothetical protein [uncultured Desulfobacteraceae bacterium]
MIGTDIAGILGIAVFWGMEKNMKQIREMNSWRTYSKVLGNRISIELPKNYDFQEVEALIIPRKIKTVPENRIGRKEWQDDFLSISQWDISEDDIRMKSWSIPEF